jgi:RNA polymerase-binding protein DksA
MNPTELERYRQQLLALGQRLKEDVGSLSTEALRQSGGQAGGNLSDTPLHLADLGSDTFDQEIALNLLENEEQRLEEIAAALARIDRGTFGLCEECHQEISSQRLQAIPFARLCIDCARKAESGPAATG